MLPEAAGAPKAKKSPASPTKSPVSPGETRAAAAFSGKLVKEARQAFTASARSAAAAGAERSRDLHAEQVARQMLTLC